MQKILIVIAFLLGTFLSSAQDLTISGYITDSQNGEALIGATVVVQGTSKGTASNSYGFYSLTLPPGSYSIVVSYIGYLPELKQIDLQKNQSVSFALTPAPQQLNEIKVSGEAANANIERVEMGMNQLPVKTIKKLPAFMGEVDIIKTIQLLPGIQSGGEASAGLYVRGGGPDENLLLLDEAPVYNASHLMGFFSIFNASAINDIKVYKSGIPAQYGGKASSVIDIRQKDGNSKQFGLDAGIGNLSSRLTLEGPLIKDKWTFIVAARRTYYDMLGKAAGIKELSDNVLYFYDLNGKSNLILNDNNRIFLSAYTGKDFFELGESMYMQWGNTTATIRWNHIFGSRLFMNVSGIYSNYDYSLGVPGTNADNFDWSSRIRDYNLKNDFTWFLNPQNTIRFGMNSILHHFRPGKVSTRGENSMFSDMELAHYNAIESSVYFANEQELSNRLTLQYGVRAGLFVQIGEGQINRYLHPDRPDEDELIETQTFKKWESAGVSFHHLEPRLAFKYSLSSQSSVKASYNRMIQNLHLISNTQSPSPLDIWLPSSTYIKPLKTNQLALGYYRNFAANTWETSIEVYTKRMKNVLDFKEGAQLFLNDAIETEILHGKGQSNGLELLLQKNSGRLTGWTAYTWSKTTRTIPGINNGKAYPSSYDRTHDLSLVGNYTLSDNWDLSATFVFATGTPVSYPVARYTIQGYQLFEYAARNSNRLPDYHRLDISATYHFKKNKTRKLQQSLNFAVYNLYGRRNAYSIRPEANSDDNIQRTEFIRLSIIGAPIPSISYTIKF